MMITNTPNPVVLTGTNFAHLGAKFKNLTIQRLPHASIPDRYALHLISGHIILATVDISSARDALHIIWHKVSEAYQRQGLGMLMHKFIFDDARRMGKKKVCLEPDGRDPGLPQFLEKVAITFGVTLAIICPATEGAMAEYEFRLTPSATQPSASGDTDFPSAYTLLGKYL